MDPSHDKNYKIHVEAETFFTSQSNPEQKRVSVGIMAFIFKS